MVWDLVIIATAVVLLLLLVWVAVRQPSWGHLNHWKAAFRESPDEILNRSSGDFDEAARLAMRRTRARLEIGRIGGLERANDHSRVSRIIRTSMVPGMLATAVGSSSPAARTDAWRRLRTAADEAAAAHASAVFHLTYRTPAAAATAAGAAPWRPDAILDDALMFDEQMRELGLLGGWEQVQAPATSYTYARAATNEERRRNAEQAAESRAGGARPAPGAVADAYLELSERHTSDGENSHDTGVVASARAILSRLTGDEHTARTARATTVDDIKRQIAAMGDTLSRDPRTGRPRPLLVTRDALPVLDRTKEGERMVSVSNGQAGSVTDEEVARVVWARTLHPSNEQRRGRLQQAYFDALVDAWKPGMNGSKVVCVQGRAMRLLGSLAMNDFDESNWDLERVEEVRNEMLVAARRAKTAAAAALYADAAAPAGVRSAAGGYAVSTPAEMNRIEDELGEATDEDEEAARGRILEAMHRAVDDAAAAANARVPGIVRGTYLDSVKKDVAAAL